MFYDKEKNNNKIETLIGEQCNFVGILNGDGLLQINGSIKGDVFWQDDVIVEVSAYCNGNISCKNAYINGKVEGNVICDNTLTIENCGKITGDITIKNFVIKEGGTFDGKCTMILTKKSDEILG